MIAIIVNNENRIVSISLLAPRPIATPIIINKNDDFRTSVEKLKTALNNLEKEANARVRMEKE